MKWWTANSSCSIASMPLRSAYLRAATRSGPICTTSLDSTRLPGTSPLRSCSDCVHRTRNSRPGIRQSTCSCTFPVIAGRRSRCGHDNHCTEMISSTWTGHCWCGARTDRRHGVGAGFVGRSWRGADQWADARHYQQFHQQSRCREHHGGNRAADARLRGSVPANKVISLAGLHLVEHRCSWPLRRRGDVLRDCAPPRCRRVVHRTGQACVGHVHAGFRPTYTGYDTDRSVRRHRTRSRHGRRPRSVLCSMGRLSSRRRTLRSPQPTRAACSTFRFPAEQTPLVYRSSIVSVFTPGGGSSGVIQLTTLQSTVYTASL